MGEGAFLREITRVLATVQYFTRLPMPGWVSHNPMRLEDTARYFPAVGCLVGSIGAVTLMAANRLWSPSIAVALSLIATVLVTGAFHEDGLADAADGLGGSRERSRVLEIMKDSRIGVFGACALVLVLLLKYATLSAMPARTAALIVIAGHAASRLGVVLIMARLPYIREASESRSQPFVARVSSTSMWIACRTGLLALAPLQVVGLGAALIVALICMMWRWYLAHRLGGYTGDCLGAVQQLGESAFYLVCAAAV